MLYDNGNTTPLTYFVNALVVLTATAILAVGTWAISLLTGALVAVCALLVAIALSAFLSAISLKVVNNVR